ncbi:MAG: hypothetical protein AAFQ01_02520, partial [Bacteroidota bacterium]
NSFLADLSAYDEEEMNRLIAINIYLYQENPAVVLDILKKGEKAGWWTKIKFYKEKKGLNKPDEALLDDFLKELAIPNE